MEYGSISGRPQRCGWMNTVHLRVNSMKEITLSKPDILRGLDELKVSVAHELVGERRSAPPNDDLELAKPLYENWPGINEGISGAWVLTDLSEAAQRYVARLEDSGGLQDRHYWREPRTRGHGRRVEPLPRLSQIRSGTKPRSPSRAPKVSVGDVCAGVHGFYRPRRDLSASTTGTGSPVQTW